jgi:hypothetical protein
MSAKPKQSSPLEQHGSLLLVWFGVIATGNVPAKTLARQANLKKVAVE